MLKKIFMVSVLMTALYIVSVTILDGDCTFMLFAGFIGICDIIENY